MEKIVSFNQYLYLFKVLNEILKVKNIFYKQNFLNFINSFLLFHFKLNP